MTTPSPALLAPPIRGGRRRWIEAGVIGSGLVVVTTLAVLNGAHPHLPDFSLLNGQPPAILTHLAGALLALGLGLMQLVGPKGTTAHRLIGWSWCLLMLAVAGSSLFIHVLNRGGFSLIHLLSAWVLIATPLAILAARRGKIATHANFMQGLFYFGLITAGIYTFFPGRLMWRLFLG
jgi:uncharacterized membrane protein